MFYLTTHSTHFIYGYMASDIWLRTILIVRKETRCRHIGYSYRLTARVLLYAPSHRQDNTYHGLWYTSHGALAGTRNSSMGPPHEGSIWRPTAPWANALPLSYVPLPRLTRTKWITDQHSGSTLWRSTPSAVWVGSRGWCWTCGRADRRCCCSCCCPRTHGRDSDHSTNGNTQTSSQLLRRVKPFSST